MQIDAEFGFWNTHKNITYTFFRELIYTAFLRSRDISTPGAGGAVVRPGAGGAVVRPGAGGAVVMPGAGGAVVMPGGAVVMPGAGGAVVWVSAFRFTSHNTETNTFASLPRPLTCPNN